MQKATAPRVKSVGGDGAPVISADAFPSPPVVVTRGMREAGGAVLERLSGVIGSEDLAERVYIAMANAPTS